MDGILLGTWPWRNIHGILLIPVTRKVPINVNLKGLGDIQAQDDAFILGAQEIPA
jgi:hypothetical protein